MKSYCIRAALVLLITGLVDCIVVEFADRPFLWASLIGASVPLSMAIFVILPMVRKQRRG